MHDIVFIRRRRLGKGSVSGMRRSQALGGLDTFDLKSWLPSQRNRPTSTRILVRWGCTAASGLTSMITLNKPETIHRVNDKILFRETVLSGTDSCMLPMLNAWEGSPLVIRPRRHAQGRHLYVVNSQDEMDEVTSNLYDWYACPLIDKASEYRVYVANGRVVTVARKTPANPNAVAWNVAQGGRFDVVRWGEWPMDVVKVAIEAFKYSGLDFGGVDVMVDKQTNKPWVLEINSAPSLPALSDGSVSYRQSVMAKYFKYVLDQGNNYLEVDSFGTYKGVIHPAVVQ